MQNLKNLGLDNAFTITVGISLLVTGVALEWAGIIDAIKYELNKMNFAQIIAGGLLTIGGSSILGKGIAGWIMSSFADSSIAAALTTAASNLGLGTATAAGAAIGAGIGGIIAGIPAYFTGIYDALKNGLNWLNGLLIPAGSTAAATGIGAIIGACGGPIGAGIGALIGLAVGLVTDGIIAIKEHWSEITTFLNKFFTVTVPGMWNKFKAWVQKLPSKVSEFFSNLWKPIENYDWYGLGKNIGTWFGNAVKSGIELVTVKIPNWFTSTWEAVKKAFSTFFTQTLPKFFTQTIPELWNTISEAFVTFFTETLPEKLSDIGTWFHDVGKAVWDGIVEGWNAGIKAIGDFIKGFVDGVKESLGIHSPSTVFAEIGRFCIEGLFNGLGETVKGIGKWVKKNIITPVKNAFTKNPVALAIKNNTSDLWNKVTNWWSSETKDGVSVETAVQLAKDGWDTVSGWIGKIPVVKQFITLAKHLWTSVKDWVGKIPTLSQFIALAKEKWESVKGWIGNIPVLEQGIKLVKSLWTTVKGWVGNIPTLDQGIALTKRLWTTVRNWIGNVPTLDQGIDEQLRLLKALQMRGDVDSVEVHHILPIFFENYQSMRVLQAVSEQNGIKLRLPVQLDCRKMFNTLNEASNYLLAACNEFSKKWDNMDIRFHAFYTVNEDEKDKQYDPVYQRYIDLFDNTPQLQEVKAEKQRLSKGELARINWYMRDVKGLDISNPADCITIIKKINDVVKEHPDMVTLFKLSEYKDLLGDEKPPVEDKLTE